MIKLKKFNQKVKLNDYLNFFFCKTKILKLIKEYFGSFNCFINFQKNYLFLACPV